MTKKLLFIFLIFSTMNIFAQKSDDELFIRIAEIEIYPEFSQKYLEIAKKVGSISVEKEQGVLCIFPMVMKDDPLKIRILEIYANQKAYEEHISSPHFVEYKEASIPMVKSLELVPMTALDEEAMKLIFVKSKKDYNIQK